MREVELSIDEHNRPAAIRDAIIGAEFPWCHGCDLAFEHSYRVGQLARRTGMSPEAAAHEAWGNARSCCGLAGVSVELLPDEPNLPDMTEKIPVPVE